MHVRDALLRPGVMTLRRLWHAIVDATHAADLGEPGNSVRDRCLQPLLVPAAAVLRRQDKKNISNIKPSSSSVMKLSTAFPLKEGDIDTTGDNKMMRYEMALLLADRLPPSAPPPLPRHWSPMKPPTSRQQ